MTSVVRPLSQRNDQPKPCDGGEEGVVVVVGDLGVQVDVEAARHTGHSHSHLGISCFGEDTAKQLITSEQNQFRTSGTWE